MKRTYRKKVIGKRILAVTAVVALMFSMTLPFGVELIYAKEDGFVIITDEYEPSGSADLPITDDHYSYEHVVLSAFNSMGEIPVSFDGSEYHFTINAWSEEGEGKDATWGGPSKRNTGSEAFSFSAPAFTTQTDANDYYIDYSGEVMGTCFQLDSPVHITSHFEGGNGNEPGSIDYLYRVYDTDAVIDAMSIYVSIRGEEEDGTKLFLNTSDATVQASWHGTQTTNDGSEDFQESGESFLLEPNGSYMAYGSFVTGEGGKDQVVTNEAKETEGETEVEIDKEIVEGKRDKKEDKERNRNNGEISTGAVVGLGVAGAVAATVGGIAAAAAGTAGGAGSVGDRAADREDAEDRKKKYKMKVYKNFGNKLKRGGQPLEVKARIVEIDVKTGAEKNRPDLSYRITGTGENMTVQDNGTDGAYKSVLISVPKEAKGEKFTLSFIYEGEGGTFRNNIIFGVADEVVMKFPEDSSPGHWALNDTGSAEMIEGDRTECHVRFYLENALEEPVQFFYRSPDQSFTVRFEPDPQYQFTYYAILQSFVEPRPETNIFSEPVFRSMNIIAVFADKSEVMGEITAALYPEGLTCKVTQVDLKDGFVEVPCYTQEGFYGDDEEAKQFYVYPRFEFTLAVKTAEGPLVISPPEREALTTGDLKTDDRWSESIAKKYPFTIEKEYHSGNFWFQQEMDLFEGTRTCYARLPVTVEYEGAAYEGEIPLHLKGLFLKPMADKETEFQKLLWVIRRYTISDADQLKWFEFAKERMGNGRVSAAALRATSRQIYFEWQANVEADTEYWLAWGKTFDNWAAAADWTKWVAARSFAVVAKTYLKTKGYSNFTVDIADALIQPAAEFVLDCVEELTDATINDRIFDIEKTEFYKKLSDGGDALAFNLLKGGVTEHALAKANSLTKKVTQSLVYVGIYLGYRTIINYMNKVQEEGEEDWPGAIFDSFKDLTANTIKSCIGDILGKWVENSAAFRARVGELVGISVAAAFRDLIEQGTAEAVGEELAAKFVDEMLGAGIADVFDGQIETSDDAGNKSIYYTFPIWEHLGEKTLYCRVDLRKGMLATATGPLAPFTLVCLKLFGTITGASTPVSFTRDPEPPSKEEINEVLNLSKMAAAVDVMR